MQTSIETQIDIKAPPERVWHAWTDPAEFVTWWGEDGLYRVTKWTGDVRPGGKWRSEGQNAKGEPFCVEGEYLVVEPPSALSFTWRHDWDGEDSITTVSLEFHRTGTGTLLKLNHSGFTNEKSCKDHEMGWSRVLGWLRGHLE